MSDQVRLIKLRRYLFYWKLLYRRFVFIFLMFRVVAVCLCLSYIASIVEGWLVTLVLDHLVSVGGFTIDLFF